MGLFDFLKKTPGAIVESGDVSFEKGQYARAIREYEKALDRSRKKDSFSTQFEEKIEAKISKTKNVLAEQHIKNASDLMESRCFDDAKELLILSMELTDQGALKKNAEKLLNEIKESQASGMSDPYDGDEFDPENEFANIDPEEMADEDDYAAVLINALPPDEQEAYLQCGPIFLKGFVAMNRGDFNEAVEHLQTAYREHRQSKTYIPLELATCYLNLGEYEKAKPLLEAFMANFPLSLRAYPVLCETLWALGDYHQALKVLDACPKKIAESPLITLLKGETLCEEKRHPEAVKVYETYLEKMPDEEMIIRALAGTYQSLGEAEKARNLYGALLDHCRNCQRKADPELKRRYADTSYETGHKTIPVLEIYLELAELDPGRQKEYYRKVSDIYASLGNEAEAGRFDAIAKRENRG